MTRSREGVRDGAAAAPSPGSADAPRNIVLIGMTGSGKTTVGRLVADILGRPFVDTDDLIEQGDGRTIPKIFEDEGEAGFRTIEARAVRDAAARPGRVIAVGGGAVMDPANVAALRVDGDLMWLDATVPELLAHLSSAAQVDGRPLLVGRSDTQLAETLERMHADRRPAYRAAATMVVVGGRRTAAELAAEVADWAGRHARHLGVVGH